MSAATRQPYSDGSEWPGRDGIALVLAGGGSGGHITPLLAVAHELKLMRPDAKIIYIGERGGRLADIAQNHTSIDGTCRIFAGKFRRYHGEGIKQLLDLPTMLKNLRDVLFVAIGFWQAIYHLWRLKPSAIFVKGSLVAVPVGLAAAVLRMPYITHDSDTMPGLANRLIARWAKLHAVAMPAEFYPYPRSKTVTTGIPLSADFSRVTDSRKKEFRHELGLDEAEQVVFVTGGGLGAVRLNNAVAAVAEPLLNQFPGLYLLHATGHGNPVDYSNLDDHARSRIITKDFINDLYKYSGAADLIITRGGASTLAEFAVQGKACVVVPNPLLTGGHQIKNATHLSALGAIRVVTEDMLKQDPGALLPVVDRLLNNRLERDELADKLGKLARQNAARKIAELLLNHVGKP
jgi:UDP-N-acetylglucosamine--N-acetylmuramyl-(pentapeptide) pyrophosphoryl-undecaprenol N-acetylglucosamine transferase